MSPHKTYSNLLLFSLIVVIIANAFQQAILLRNVTSLGLHMSLTVLYI